MTQAPAEEEIQRLASLIQEVEKGVNSVILGKEGLVRDFLTGVLAGGHILLEGLPGLGKTMMVRAFAMLCNLKSRRIQFTPDLMPLDITGSYLLNEVEGRREYEFHPGPLFANIVLADEINRASPKTQSALLEAMQERMATVLGNTHRLPEPFMVLATQNPIELEGTYPLPEAQVDRFLFKLDVKDVPPDILKRVIIERGGGQLPELDAVLEREELLQAVQAAAAVHLPDAVASYIARVVHATHKGGGVEFVERFVRYGASPRAALSMAQAARARALIEGRNSAGFEDVKAVAPPTLRHRVILDYSAKVEGVSAEDAVKEVLSTVQELERDAPETVGQRKPGEKPHAS